MLEKDTERKLVKEIKDRRGLCLKLVSPGSKGVPDRLVLLPGGRTYLIELKRSGEELEPLQRIWRDRIESRGHKHRTVIGEAGLFEFLREVDDEICAARISSTGD